MFKNLKPYIISVLLALGVGALSAYITRDSMDIYSEIINPPLAPPAILFPIVWTILFILMGISAANVYVNRKNGDAGTALTVYAINLIMNSTII